MRELFFKIKQYLKSKFEPKRVETNKINKNNAVVYINKPINEIQNDVLGIKTQLNRIDMAIEEGANVIGIIGDYGTGKSSLIELLKNKYQKPIIINMWNNVSNISEKDENNKNNEINNLTRNFLFQMAIGENAKFAQYISKKMSKNYGILSIIKSGKKFWCNFIWAIIFGTIYKTAENLPNSIYDSALYKSLNNAYGVNFFPDGFFQDTIYVLYGIVVNFYILFAIVALIFAIKAILKTTIVFSLWDSQGKRVPDTTDIYDMYLEIAQRILENDSKRIVIIEDLDRINDIDNIKEFIKEIYRFNNILPQDLKNKLVYIIEVKSEDAMKKIESQIEEENNTGLFKKIFYFKVSLNPIHSMDYDEIVLELLKAQEEKIKQNLNINLENTLPKEFAYIVKGSNLTIRDLKERLNRSFEIYENLNEKGQENGAVIDYKKCTIVAYLESKYPKNIRKFISKEKEFADLLEKSYVIKQTRNVSLTDKTEQIKELIDNTLQVEFIDEVADLIANDLIDDDFRLYFYNYPKGQRIKSSEEEYVERLLLYPNNSKDIDEEKIKKALEKDKDVIFKCYERRTKENLLFNRIIFENETLYSIAIEYFYDKVQEVLQKDIKWKAEYKNESGKILEKISKYNIDSKKLLEEYSEFLTTEFKQLSEKELIAARIEIIKNCNNYLECFKSIFINDDISLISKEEIYLIKDMSIVMELINKEAINEESEEYIIEFLNQKALEEDFDKAKDIYYAMDETIDLENVASEVLAFLNINNKVDNKLFFSITKSFVNDRGAIDENELVCYLNSLNVDEFTNEYFSYVDMMQITGKLVEEILCKLKEKSLKHTLWINLILQNRANEINLEDDIENNIEVIMEIMPVIENEIIILRKEIIKRNMSEEYKQIFFREYPIISEEEIDIITNINDIKIIIDFSRVESNEINNIVEKINQIYSTKEELLSIIEIFDKSKGNNTIKDISLINYFFDKFEWKNKLIRELTEEQRSYIYNILKDSLRLTDYNYSIKFCYKIDYILTEIDNQLYIKAKNDITCYNQYTDLINQLDIPTEQTLTNIINFGKEEKFNINICDGLWNEEYYTESIIGRILWEDRVDVSLAEKSLDEYTKAYNKTIKAHDIMANNRDFMQLLMNNEKYVDIKTINKLKPFYNLRQPIKFVKHVFESLEDQDIYEYLRCRWELDTEEDSLEFQKLICEDNYIKFIETSEMYLIVWHKLWKASHKTLLTKARNKKYNL